MKKLSRKEFAAPAAPVRIVHIGLGNFFRAHQAFFTANAADATDWGIAAFTGRGPRMAELLNPQDGLYTLITKNANGNDYRIIPAISVVHAASEYDKFVQYFESPDLAVVTSTVTEAGYCRNEDGSLNVDHPAIVADLEVFAPLLKDNSLDIAKVKALPLTSAPLRIVGALLARRAANLGPITILPCDNIPDNGAQFSRVVTQAASHIDPSLLDWMQTNVAWATCMVDRITPATTEEEIAAVQNDQGYEDAAPVPTEPFSEWVISGDFPAGRPDWQSAGAQIVADVQPYEQRKLWMLNGSHSLMAYAGPILGKETVADAIVDPTIRAWVHQWWADAGSGLSIGWEEYVRALTERFENPNIRHLLAQIAHDGSQKIPVRIRPTLLRYADNGEVPQGALRAIAAWTLHLRGEGSPIKDVEEEKVTALVGASLEDDIKSVLDYVAGMANNPDFVSCALDCAQEIMDMKP